MSDDKEEIKVTEKDEIIIPLTQTEEVTPGVFRITPNAAFREWVKRQASIKIV